MAGRRAWNELLEFVSARFLPQPSNPGDASTLWVNSGDGNKVYFGNSPVSSGGGGTVDAIIAGANITVDDTDPSNPIVGATISNEFATLLVGDVAGGDYTEFEADGTMVAKGEATTWTDLRVAASDTNAVGANPPVTAIFKNDGVVPAGSYAISFAGTSDGIITIPDNVAYDTSADYSIEFWVQPKIGTDTFTEFLRKEGVFVLNFWNPGELSLNATNMGFDATAAVMNIGAWNHICLTLDQAATSTYTIYVNGVSVGSIVSGGSPADTANPFEFNRLHTEFDVDYIAIWNKTLSGAEVTSRYDGGAGAPLVGNEANLVGLWELNENTGTTLDDKTATANDASVSSGVENTDWSWISGHVAAIGGGSLGVVAKFFQPSVRQEVFFQAQFPHEREIDSDVNPHMHVAFPTDGAPGEMVRFGLEYTAAGVGSIFGNTTTIYADTLHISEDIVGYKHYIMSFPAIAGTELPAISAMINCRLFRDATDVSDNYPDACAFLEFDFHYLIDTLGSREPFVK